MVNERPTPDSLITFMAGPTGDIGSITSAVNIACDMLDEVLESAFRPMPDSLYQHLALQVAHSVYKRGASVSGSSQYAFDEGQPVFDPKDELNRIWPQLRRYVTPFPLPPVVVVT